MVRPMLWHNDTIIIAVQTRSSDRKRKLPESKNYHRLKFTFSCELNGVII